MSQPGSPRSVVSGTWDQVIDFIISSSEADAQSIHEGRHEPTIHEEEEPVRPGRTYTLPFYRPRSIFRPNNYVDAWNQGVQHYDPRRESDWDSMHTTARASTIDDLRNYDLDIQLNDVDIDTTLKLPETKSIHKPEEEEDDDAVDNDAADDIEADAEKEAADDHNEKAARLSRSGSHSGSSTVNEDHLDDGPKSKDAKTPEPMENIDLEENAAETRSVTAPPTNKAPYSAFPTKAKRLIVLSAASASIFAPLSMQIYLPSLNNLVDDFGVNRTKINLTVSVYMIFMAISPMIMGGIADVIGRRPALMACFSVYMVSCVLIALCHTYPELMGFRILQSIGASPTIAIASAVVADIVTSAERGSYAALVAVPVIFAPTLGPVIGGLLTEFLGWRSIFWFLLIAGAVGFLLIGLAFPETCRVIVGDASARSPKLYRSALQAARDTKPLYSETANAERARLRGTSSRAAMLWNSLTSAVRVLFTKDRFLLLFYVGLIFSGFNAIATELPTQFKAIYGYDSVMIGVMYIPMAGGAMISTAIFGKQMNKNFRKYAARQGINIEAGQQVDMIEFPVEKARLEITIVPLLLSTAGIVCWGWVLEMKTSIAAPCVLLFVMGVGLNGVMASTNALLMDISSSQAGAVMAASNLTRCALGAVASAVIQTMIDSLGLGWTYVIFGVVFLMFSPMLIVQYYKGQQWRKASKVKEDQKLAQEALKGKAPTNPETGSVHNLEEQGAGPEGPTSLRFSTMQSYSRRPDTAKAAEVEAAAAGAPIPLMEMKIKEESPRNSVGSKKA